MTSRLLPGWDDKTQFVAGYANSPDGCGFTCDAMARQWTSGVTVSPQLDQTQTPEAGASYLGYDYSVWMTQELRAHGVVVTPLYGTDPATALQAARNNLGAGRPTIVLSDETFGPHYTVLIGQRPSGDLVRSNPATGRESLDPATWQSRFAGDVLLIGSPLYAGTLFARYRVTTPQFLRDAPDAASNRTYLMEYAWEGVALGPLTPDWILVADLTGQHVGWMLRANMVYEGTSTLPGGFTSACGSAEVYCGL